jgi:hypothetical protein
MFPEGKNLTSSHEKWSITKAIILSVSDSLKRHEESSVYHQENK